NNRHHLRLTLSKLVNKAALRYKRQNFGICHKGVPNNDVQNEWECQIQARRFNDTKTVKPPANNALVIDLNADYLFRRRVEPGGVAVFKWGSRGRRHVAAGRHEPRGAGADRRPPQGEGLAYRRATEDGLAAHL